MARVFLSLGSNLGDRRAYLTQALRRLQDLDLVRVVTCSRVYETEPWPEEEVPRERWYLNCAVEIETGLEPHRLLELAQAIESDAGRVREAPAGPAPYPDRTLDIDILLYEDQVVSEYRLMIPHPLLHERRFVLEPLAEIAPEVEHPVLYRPIRDLLAELADERGIHPYGD
jgi:2-amino-4-hydroxy-6-hydroxymethyldihydropteridine diphosphokinase